jgi:hypothetical protein
MWRLYGGLLYKVPVAWRQAESQMTSKIFLNSPWQRAMDKLIFIDIIIMPLILGSITHFFRELYLAARRHDILILKRMG